ncbi:CinA family protein [Nocardia thailandica]|uniref:CinA family protein n=1 Tax=Nocardia thailandica TaxID=257275 RepID=A0ABW6PUI9_9NOCA|nr:CinA family protein [Nocardia thailandica]
MTTPSEIAEFAREHGLTVAVAESLTGGNLAAALSAAPDSAEWFRGGVVAYSAQVKREVLGVPDVPVVSEIAARAMADGVRALTGADVAVATTGVGGPGAQDGEPAGSVWCAVSTPVAEWAVHNDFAGPPEQVLDQAISCALDLAFAGLRKQPAATS